MKFQLPKTVKVGAFTYRIKTDAKLSEKSACEGEWSTDDLTITLQAGMPEARNLQVWVHELIHGVLEDRGINLSEKTIDQLAFGLAAVIVDNGWKVGA